MSRILEKSFRYTPSFNTDLRKSFRKAKDAIKTQAEQEAAKTAAQAARDAANAAEAQAKVAKTKITRTG